MRRIISVILITAFVLAILAAIKNPGFLKDYWLWLVGLIGPITALLKKVYSFIKVNIKEETNNKSTNS